MKIVQCSDSFLPVVDGVGRVAVQYAERLAKAGHEVYVVTPLADMGYRGGLPYEMIDFLSAKTPMAPQYRTGVSALDPHYIERIRDLAPDVIHVHTPGLTGAEAHRLAEKTGAPLVGTFHSKYYDDFLRVTGSDVLAELGSRFVAEFYERCDEVWTVSNDAAETLRSYGYKGDIVVMPNGTEMRVPDIKNEEKAREEFSLSPGEPSLLYVGQIDFKKNLKNIVDAAGLLVERGRRFRLVFAGQGQDRDALEERARELSVPLLFTGHVSDRALLDGLYMAAELFLFPSVYDTAGLVVREAAVMGTPSVVTRGTAPAEAVEDGVNGFCCDDSPEALARTIESYVWGLSDEEKAGFRRRAMEQIPLPWERVMVDVQARYESLCGRIHEKRGAKELVRDAISEKLEEHLEGTRLGDKLEKIKRKR